MLLLKEGHDQDDGNIDANIYEDQYPDYEETEIEE